MFYRLYVHRKNVPFFIRSFFQQLFSFHVVVVVVVVAAVVAKLFFISLNMGERCFDKTFSKLFLCEIICFRLLVLVQ